MRLENKTALITGGTTGIGFATAKHFLEEGARVAILGQNEERLKIAAAELASYHPANPVLAVQADVASANDMAKAANKVQEAFGSLDVLFANAGIAQALPFSDITEDHLNDLVSVNLNGAVWTVQKMLPLLNNPASVILTSTTFTQQGAAGFSVYTATKAAVTSLARSLSAELIERGIRVNTISPGPIETPIYGKLGLPQATVETMAGQILGKVPMSRFGQPDEIAKVALFLASDDSSYILGEDILVDGGMANV